MDLPILLAFNFTHRAILSADIGHEQLRSCYLQRPFTIYRLE